MARRLDDVVLAEKKVKNRAERLFGILQLIEYAAIKHGAITHRVEHSYRTEITWEASYKNFRFVHASGEYCIYGDDFYVYEGGNLLFHLRSTEPVDKASDLTETGPYAAKIEIEPFVEGPWEERLHRLASRNYKQILSSYYTRQKELEERNNKREARRNEPEHADEIKRLSVQESAKKLGPYL